MKYQDNKILESSLVTDDINDLEIIEDVYEPQKSERAVSTFSSKKSLLHNRRKYNQSQGPSLKNDYSFVNSNYNAASLKSKLMDINQTMDSIPHHQSTTFDNSHKHQSKTSLNKTSLVLPPLSIGNMQKSNRILNMGKQGMAGYVSPLRSTRNAGRYMVE